MKVDPLLDRPWWAADWVPQLDDERSMHRLRRLVWTILLAGLLAFVIRGADQPADPFLPNDGAETVPSTGGS